MLALLLLAAAWCVEAAALAVYLFSLAVAIASSALNQ
jgi:hypothetical protein